MLTERIARYDGPGRREQAGFRLLVRESSAAAVR
jgi:hypothetical protein